MDVSLFGGLSTGPSRGQLVYGDGEETGNGHGGCMLAECLRAHLCLCGLGFQKQASAQDCPHCCDFHLQALCSFTHRKGPGSDPGWLWSWAVGQLGQEVLPLGRAMWNAGSLTSLPQGSGSLGAPPTPGEKPEGWLGSEWLPFLVSGGPFRAGAQPRCPRRED